MKRTTYIIIGLIVLGMLVTGSITFWKVGKGVGPFESEVTTSLFFGAEQEHRDFACVRVIQIKNKNNARMPCSISLHGKADSCHTSLFCAKAMGHFMHTEVRGDTLQVDFGLPREYAHRNRVYLVDRLVLEISPEVQLIDADDFSFQASGLACDSLVVNGYSLTMSGCHVRAVRANTSYFHDESGNSIETFYDDVRNH